jgi:pimeloyl-ACP methyl ester carboxylesterase
MHSPIFTRAHKRAVVNRRTVIKTLAAGLAAGAMGDRPSRALAADGDAGLPPAQFVRTNGIKLAVYEQGPDKNVPLVLCHGFPELAYSWRHQLPALAAGYRAIAPDQRGYGLSDRPEKVEAYTIIELCNDMVGLLDAKGINKAVFCGHDWGGIVVWMMPLLHPDRVAGVIGVNTPLFRRSPAPPIAMLRQMRGDDNYMVAFQQPGVADRALAADVRKTFTMLMRRGGLFKAEAFAKLPLDAPERKFQLLKMLEAPVESFGGEMFLKPQELDFFVDTFTKTGFTGGINWYRNLDRNWELTKDVMVKVDVPSLYVGAADDVVLPPSSANGMEQLVGDLEKQTIADCGHWTQQEKPDELNRIVIDWLKRKFPA